MSSQCSTPLRARPFFRLCGTISQRNRGPQENAHSGGRADSFDMFGKDSYHSGMKAVISEKGQVTIPKPLRDRLGLRPGHILDFTEEPGR